MQRFPLLTVLVYYRVHNAKRSQRLDKVIHENDSHTYCFDEKADFGWTPTFRQPYPKNLFRDVGGERVSLGS